MTTLAMFSLNGFTVAQPVAPQHVPETARELRQFHDGEYDLQLRKVSAIHGRVAIYSRLDEPTGQRRLRVEFASKSRGEDDVRLSDAIVISDDDAAEVAFDSFIDERTGFWCLYDTSGKRFVMLVALPDDNRHPTYDFWHPGIRVGWGRGIWANYFKKIRAVHDELPYKVLPSELEIVKAE